MGADNVSGLKSSEQSSGSQRQKFQQERSKFEAQEHKLKTFWGPGSETWFRCVLAHFNHCLFIYLLVYLSGCQQFLLTVTVDRNLWCVNSISVNGKRRLPSTEPSQDRALLYFETVLSRIAAVDWRGTSRRGFFPFHYRIMVNGSSGRMQN